MAPLILAYVVLGAALERFFKFFVLAPLTAAIAVIVVMEPSFWPHSALPKTVQVLVLAASLQFGYTLPMWLQCLTAMLRRHINFRPESLTDATAVVQKEPTLTQATECRSPVPGHREHAPRAIHPCSIKSGRRGPIRFRSVSMHPAKAGVPTMSEARRAEPQRDPQALRCRPVAPKGL
jgi:hypothetical protein